MELVLAYFNLAKMIGYDPIPYESAPLRQAVILAGIIDILSLVLTVMCAMEISPDFSTSTANPIVLTISIFPLVAAYLLPHPNDRCHTSCAVPDFQWHVTNVHDVLPAVGPILHRVGCEYVGRRFGVLFTLTSLVRLHMPSKAQNAVGVPAANVKPPAPRR